MINKREENVEKIKDIFWKFYHKLETGYYNIKIGVPNLFRWSKVVFFDRDWDYEESIREFIYQKLKSLQKRNWEDRIVEGWWMKQYLNLCILIIDEQKKMEDLEDDLWNSVEPGEMITSEEPNKDGNYRIGFKWSSPKAAKKYQEVMKIRNIRERKLRKLFYSILEKRSQSWWD